MLKKTEKRNFYRENKIFFASLILLLCFSFFNSCSETADNQTAGTNAVTAQEIIENPNAYAGKTVTVSGDVEEVYEPRAFHIDSGISAGELLVVGREPFPKVPDEAGRAILAGDIATVT